MPTTPPASRRIAAFVLYLVAVALIGGLLAPILWHIVEALRGTPGADGTHPGVPEWLSKASFRRVATRSFMIVAILGFWPLLRALRLRADRVQWGYNIALGPALLRVAGGVVFGLVTMALLVGGLALLGVRSWDPTVEPGVLVSVLVSGVLSGIIISIIEESVFRGATFAALRNAFSIPVAVVCSAIAYSAVHFIGTEEEIVAVHWYSGFAVLANSFHRYADPSIFGPFLALVMVGIFLALIRNQTGHIAWGIGIHAGWVAMIRGGRKAFDYHPESPWAWLAPPSYDAITGYLAAAYLASWCILLLLAIRWHAKRKLRALTLRLADLDPDAPLGETIVEPAGPPRERPLDGHK